MSRRGVAGGLLLVVSLTAAGLSAGRLETQRAGRPAAAQVLYLPSGDYLRILSLGYPEVLADLIYLWSIQYYSNYETDDRYMYLEHIYGNVIGVLDPRYEDPFLIGSLIMGLEAGDFEMALRLLDKGMAANPDSWLIPFEAGFTAYSNLADYDRAAVYFERAMEIPGAPAAIRRMHAEMFNKMGDKRTALRYWKQIHDETDHDYVKDISARHVHDLGVELDLETLAGAIETYRDSRGKNPPRLEALVEAGILASVPRDPEGALYEYDPATGDVTSRSRWRLFRKDGH